jgi:hypothetical protein
MLDLWSSCVASGLQEKRAQALFAEVERLPFGIKMELVRRLLETPGVCAALEPGLLSATAMHQIYRSDLGDLAEMLEAIAVRIGG